MKSTEKSSIRSRIAAGQPAGRVRCVGILLALVCLRGTATSGEDRVEFNRDVRPILSNKCFKCHGFDEKSREANLRLDMRDGAVGVRDGQPAVVPGKPDESELIRRIEAANPDERMPPPDSNRTLSKAEKDTLRRWIAGGAEYQPHWSLMAPHAVPLPPIQQERAHWPRNEIDHFVLAKLTSAGLTPSPEASPENLLRRVTLDLTGLSPTIAELDLFLSEYGGNANAYERAVDRLLASHHFGERMAVEWLDIARYADTNGYFSDKTRSVWPWRDWVIAAYNCNLPFDQFTIEQLAGDLLANPTIDQRIATGFNRNHMANNETGIIDEEYRVEYVADRLETTAAAWLGLTVGCARCHDHKFDPITQKEFYQLFAFFNNGPEAGLITQENPPPLIEVPSPEQQQKMTELVAARNSAEQAFAPMETALQTEIAEWESKAANQLDPSPHDKLAFHVDFENRIDIRVGWLSRADRNYAKAGSALESQPTYGKPVSGTAPAAGESGVTRPAASAVPLTERNVRQVGTSIKYERGVLGSGATFDATQHAELDTAFDVDAAWTIGIWLRGDSSLGCVLSKIEPAGNRRGLEILWQKGRLGIHLVNRWGVNAIEIVTTAPLSSKSWHHLVLSYDASQKAAGLRVYLNGQPAAANVERDSLGGTIANGEPLRIARRDSGLGFYGQLDELRVLRRIVTDREVDDWFWSERLRGIIASSVDSRSAADKSLLMDYYLGRFANQAARESRQRVVAARKAVDELQASIPTALVMQELAQPRVTTVLTRGQYDRRAETVQPEVPVALTTWPADAPRNRLGFARWLTSPSHPLTARVAVNRLWQQCFGEGIVRTVNDFGSQGEVPTHPELLDWLAVKFVDRGWDVKAMLRLIVTSAAYRQSSATTLELLRRDPENRLLARAPSFRLAAETIRDQALAISGLLVPRIGGPSVKPYQPPGLWEAVSYNGEETYVVDQGEGLWRRSLYSFWKRQAPPPALLVFDGPTREKCTLRRPRTNTPLQALVLLNDETYLVAARALAEKVLSERGSDEERLCRAFRSATSRVPDRKEVDVLVALLQKQRVRYFANVTGAKQMLAVRALPGHELDAVELDEVPLGR